METTSQKLGLGGDRWSVSHKWGGELAGEEPMPSTPALLPAAMKSTRTGALPTERWHCDGIIGLIRVPQVSVGQSCAAFRALLG